MQSGLWLLALGLLKSVSVGNKERTNQNGSEATDLTPRVIGSFNRSLRSRSDFCGLQNRDVNPILPPLPLPGEMLLLLSAFR
jgi:hypothetical protein